MISMLVILALCVAATSCRKDNPSTPANPDNTDNPNNTEIPNSPTDCIDPEDAVTVNLRNDGGSVTIFDCPLMINIANNFVSGSNYTTFVNIGEVSGLGCINSIPQSGWSSQVAVIPGNGYVIKCEKYNGANDTHIVKYARLYVVRYILSATNEGILGAELKYQENWCWLGAPIVSTGIITEITSTTAICSGNVISDGGIADTERGICWSAFEGPTINDHFALCGTGIGDYVVQMTNLMPFTIYHVRAYAKNELGINYGEQITFRTKTSLIGYSNIVLNELNGNDKFIEIYNRGDIDLPLEGMYIVKDGSLTNWIADATVVAPANGYVLLYSEDVAIDHPNYPESLVFHSGLSAKKNIRLQLFTPAGVSVDDFNLTNIDANDPAYIPAPASYSRNANGIWHYADGTPGYVNVDGIVPVLGLEGGAKWANRFYEKQSKRD